MTASLPDRDQPSTDDVTLITGHVLGRRRLLQLGGVAAAAAALLAACGGDSPAAGGQVPQAGVPISATTTAPAVLSDVTLLRTVESIARAMTAAYAGVIASGKVTTPEVSAGLRLFSGHYTAQITAVETAIRRMSGTPYGDPNALMMSRVITPGLAALKDETSAVALLQRIESVTADSLQIFIPLLSTGPLRQQVMAMGGVAARQAAVTALRLPYGVVVVVPNNAVLPLGVTTTTTTTIPGTVVPDPVFAVPGSFGSTAAAIGPSYYV